MQPRRSIGLSNSRLTHVALAALMLSLLMFVLRPALANATEADVTVGPAEVSAALFVAGDVARLSTVPAGTQALVQEKALQQMYADEPELSPSVAESYVRDMQLALSAASAPSPASLQLMAGNQRILAILAALERPYGEPAVELPPAAKLAVSHLAAVALSGSSNIFAGAEEPKFFEPLADARTNLTFTSFAPANVLRATRTLASENKLFGEARDALWASASEESVFSEWKELLVESGVLQSKALETLRKEVEAGEGTITEELEHLTALFGAGQTATQEQSCKQGSGKVPIGTESIKGIPPLECSDGALYEAATAPHSCTTECKEKLEGRQSSAAKREEAIAEEHAAMVAAAELLRPSDNKAAELQVATAQAQAQITEEEVAWASYEAEKAEKEAIAKGVQEGLGVGTSVLALATDNYSEGIGGLIGVGFEIYEGVEGALSNPPPGPQEITLQDLADLSNQLAGFQQYTQEAFHAINTQVAELSAQLARENYELKTGIEELGERLVKEQTTIYALQNEVQTLFATQTKANLQQTIEDSVGWLARTGEPLSATRFQEDLVALKKYATEIANGALVNNAETRPYDFEGAFQQLTSKTTGEPAQLSEDISYLARFPGEAGWPSTLVPASLANTTFWAESSRAYAQLMLENAGHTTAADIAGVKALENEAVKLNKTEGAWSEDSAPGSATGNTILNEAIAKFAAAAYGNGVNGVESVKTLLQEAAEESFDQYLSKDVSKGSVLANPTGVGLWDTANHAFSAGAVVAAGYPALKWEECSGSEGENGKQAMPERFIENLPRALVNGVRLGVVGAPGSGDPLILEACRTITNAKESKAKVVEKTVSNDEVCPEWGGVRKDCEVDDVFKARSETNEEKVTETLALTEGSNKYTLASPTTCEQKALHWRGSGELYTEDATTKTKEDFYEGTWSGSFAERHVGTVELKGAYIKDSGKEVEWGPEYSEDPYAVFEGSHCPYEGGEEKAGVEYATYGGGESPFGSGAQISQATMVEKVDAKLRELQHAAYSKGREALEIPPHGNPAESLAGARALVQSYVKLGLPQALDSDVALQGDIEGLGAQFLDPKPGSPVTPRPVPAQLHALIGSWIEGLEKASGTSLTQLLEKNPIEEVQSRSEAWAKAVAGEVKLFVEGKANGFNTGAEEKVGQQSALVESTLNRLQLTRDVLTEAKAPTAETLAASEVGVDEATLRGEVAPNDGAVEECVFEYGATETYGHTIECSSVPKAKEKAVIVSAKIASWTPEGSFHERVVMKTWGGTSYGEDVKVQLAQSATAPSGGTLLASTSSSGATIGKFTAEELPPGVSLPAGAEQIVGSVAFTVNVAPGGTARVKIELPGGKIPNALYKLEHLASGEQYVEIPTSLYTISGSLIELTLVDGGPDDEDGEVNGVIVDPLVPVVKTGQPAPVISPPAPVKETPIAPAKKGSHPAPPQCVSGSSVTMNLASDLGLAAGTTIEHSEILVGGKVVARLGSRAKVASVSFAGHRGPYAVTVVATLSNGKTLRRKIVFHTCSVPASVSRECVSNGSLAVHLAYHLKLPKGTKVRSSEILVRGHVVAKLGAKAKVAVVSFAGLGKPYEVTLVAKLSNGKTKKQRIVFHACGAKG